MSNLRPAARYRPSMAERFQAPSGLGITAAVLALGVLLGACGGAPRGAVPATTGRPTATPSSAVGAVPAGSPGYGPAQALGITAVQMAPATGPDGSASGPRTVFDAAQDRKIVAVLTLSNLPAGTVISYVRYLDDKYVNAKSSTLHKTSKYFYFEFSALPGKTFTPGHYRLRLYVNQQPALETGYDVR
ncbi:MAG: hypothetical protein NVSMB32_16960 [Actinomycetota bacterium]